MKKLLAIVVLNLILSGCVTTNEIGIYNDVDTPNYRVKKLQYEESKTFKFKKYIITNIFNRKMEGVHHFKNLIFFFILAIKLFFNTT